MLRPGNPERVELQISNLVPTQILNLSDGTNNIGFQKSRKLTVFGNKKHSLKVFCFKFLFLVTQQLYMFFFVFFNDLRLTESQANQTVYNQTKLILTRIDQNQPNQTKPKKNYLKVLRNSCTDPYLFPIYLV